MSVPVLTPEKDPKLQTVSSTKTNACSVAVPIQEVAQPTGEVRRCSEASVVAISGDASLVAYGVHAGTHDNAQGFIAAKRLDGEGKPEGTARVLVDTPAGGMNTMSPALRRLPDGRIGMLYSHRTSVREARRCFCASEDEGVTWSAPVVVADGGYVTGCHDRFTVLSSGRLIAPLHGTDDWDKHHLYVTVAWSDDGGGRWIVGDQRLTLAPVGPEEGRWLDSGCLEPAVAERGDGSLLMTMRTAMGTQFRSDSHDGGETWSLPRSMEVVSPSAPANLTRIPATNDLLLIWTPTYDPGAHHLGERRTLVACVSRDGGRSWPVRRRKLLVHDPVHPVDYPSVMYRGDEVWITVRRSEGPQVLEGSVSTLLMRVPLRWFYEEEREV